MAEQVNRQMTFVAAYRIAKVKAWITRKRSRAKRLLIPIPVQQGEQDAVGRGAVGGTLMTFKTYSIAYVELLHRMYTQGGQRVNAPRCSLWVY